METMPPDDQIEHREPLRCSEWPIERLLWELVHKADPQRLNIISFELQWREEQYKVEYEAAK